MAAIAAAAQVAVSPGKRPTRFSVAAAGVIAVPALYLLVGSVVRFRKHRTTVDPRAAAEATSLVTGGPNAWSRNPMYAGMLGLLVAHSVARRSAVAALPAAGFAVWIDRAQIPPEEQHLEARFGARYVAYTRRVRRWI
ncbi:methyltransferase family protein [Leucobacter luti]|uniref:Protein-S-isoprenylcysteine O-methyltransferase Ste14 n=1 Tax=Leucobacter luti TaxID=340320 RepID=A0A4V6MCG7_9MICO|nr:isoprenylcysteine carboxylmethyltransferase family protein [Leucobacter luti]RZT64509.1 protein-S-isoprenylcysteine O-methyltransferase Ste14 [Leucobacter luti]